MYNCKPWRYYTYSNCPVYMVGHLIDEVRKNVLTPASLDACTLTDASHEGENSSTASAKPPASVASV